MPSTSDAQRRFMQAAAHDPKFAAKAGIPQSVAVEFNNADTEVDPQKVYAQRMARVLRQHAKGATDVVAKDV